MENEINITQAIERLSELVRNTPLTEQDRKQYKQYINGIMQVVVEWKKLKEGK